MPSSRSCSKVKRKCHNSLFALDFFLSFFLCVLPKKPEKKDDSRESMLAFAKIADSLHQQYGYSLLAQMDAALALLLAYKAAENLGDFIERRGKSRRRVPSWAAMV